MPLPPRPPPLGHPGFATLVAVLAMVVMPGARNRAGAEDTPSMPAPAPRSAESPPVAKEAPAKPPIDLAAPKTVATATFALG